MKKETKLNILIVPIGLVFISFGLMICFFATREFRAYKEINRIESMGVNEVVDPSYKIYLGDDEVQVVFDEPLENGQNGFVFGGDFEIIDEREGLEGIVITPWEETDDCRDLVTWAPVPCPKEELTFSDKEQDGWTHHEPQELGNCTLYRHDYYSNGKVVREDSDYTCREKLPVSFNL